MAATVAASKSYDLSGGALREDLQDVIYDISPMETIFLTRAARATVKSTTHEWLTDSLTTAARNAQIEGNDFTAVARALPARLKTYTQISRKDFEVTGTAQAVENAGMRELMAYHTARAGKELKRDIEVAALGQYHGTAGSSVLARTTSSVQCWMYTNNHIKISGQTTSTTPAPSSGFASAVTAGSASAFASGDLDSMLSQAWSCGGETDTVLCGSTMYNKISTFTSLATRFRDVGSRQQAQIIGAADVYVSPYGSHNIVLSRWVNTDAVLALDMKTWAIGYLRPFKTVDIAKIGDAERKMILAEWCVIAKSPLANTKVTAVTS
jgi:hypothetical protein